MTLFDAYVIFGIPAISVAIALAFFYFTGPKAETKRNPSK
jgi:hypothetical protein